MYVSLEEACLGSSIENRYSRDVIGRHFFEITGESCFSERYVEILLEDRTSVAIKSSAAED